MVAFDFHEVQRQSYKNEKGKLAGRKACGAVTERDYVYVYVGAIE
jgi:hypothetical protein